MKGVSLALLLAFAALPAAAVEMANRPEVDTSALPPIAEDWPRVNPYRGLPAAIEVGRATFAQTCARCHGPDADATGHPAPDLRRLDLACRRIGDPAIRAACLSDNDVFFTRSVRGGKVIVGITHMPPWEEALTPQLVWAIRSFIETRPLGHAQEKDKGGDGH